MKGRVPTWFYMKLVKESDIENGNNKQNLKCQYLKARPAENNFI